MTIFIVITGTWHMSFLMCASSMDNPGQQLGWRYGDTMALWNGNVPVQIQDKDDVQSTEDMKILFICLIKYFYLCVYMCDCECTCGSRRWHRPLDLEVHRATLYGGWKLARNWPELSLEHAWQKERSDSCKLSSDLCAVVGSLSLTPSSPLFPHTSGYM